jgi:hypothetical protein
VLYTFVRTVLPHSHHSEVAPNSKCSLLSVEPWIILSFIFFLIIFNPFSLIYVPLTLFLRILIASFSVSQVQFYHESWNWGHQPYVIIPYIITTLLIEVLRNALWLYVSRAGSSEPVDQLLGGKMGRYEEKLSTLRNISLRLRFHIYMP